MNVIDLTAREGLESEILILAAELTQRAEEGARSFHHAAKLARRVLALTAGETLAH